MVPTANHFIALINTLCIFDKTNLEPFLITAIIFVIKLLLRPFKNNFAKFALLFAPAPPKYPAIKFYVMLTMALPIFTCLPLITSLTILENPPIAPLTIAAPT